MFDRVLQWAEKQGMKPADLARLFDESPQTVNNWTVRGAIPRDKLTKISSKTGLSIDYLITGKARPESGFSAREPGAGYGAIDPALFARCVDHVKMVMTERDVPKNSDLWKDDVIYDHAFRLYQRQKERNNEREQRHTIKNDAREIIQISEKTKSAGR